jgi:uncharacterized protein (TIGR02284 family)
MSICTDEEVVRKLKELIELDADAMLLYDKALEHVEDPVVTEAFEAYRADHGRHVGELTQLVLDLGGTPPPADRDFKGTLLEAVTALRSATGTRGALKALRTNEKIMNKHYEEAADMELPAPVAIAIAARLADERRHRAGIDAELERLERIRKHIGMGEDRVEEDDGDSVGATFSSGSPPWPPSGMR